jgi:hypothetical protein
MNSNVKTTSLAASERRALKRNLVAAHERITIKVNGQSTGTVLDINSLGLRAEFPKSEDSNFSLSQIVSKIEVYSSEKLISQFPTAMVCHVVEMNPGKVQVGFLFGANVVSAPIDQIARDHRRLTFASDFLPVGFFDNPIVFNDLIQFKVSNITPTGALLITSARNHWLLRGMRINRANITFPSVGTTVVGMEILWVKKVEGSDKLRFGVKFFKKPKTFHSYVAQYLLLFGVGTSEEVFQTIIDSGIRTKETKKTVTYSLAKEDHEYGEILKLRVDAYARAGKVRSDCLPAEMADEFDSRSYLIVAKHRGLIVG